MSLLPCPKLCSNTPSCEELLLSDVLLYFREENTQFPFATLANGQQNTGQSMNEVFLSPSTESTMKHAAAISMPKRRKSITKGFLLLARDHTTWGQ